MKTISKFPISVKTTIQVSKGALCLDVIVKYGQWWIYYLQEKDSFLLEERTIEAIPTDALIDFRNKEYSYIRTLIVGPLTYHFFEVKEK